MLLLMNCKWILRNSFKELYFRRCLSHHNARWANYDSGDYALALNKALEEADYESLLSDQQIRRQENSTKQLGIGISAYVEVTAPAGLHSEYGAVEVHDDGTVTAGSERVLMGKAISLLSQ